MKRIVFDIETEPFTAEFKEATTAKSRTKHAPKMRVACIFDESHGEYKYFAPRNAPRLIKELQSADEVVGFNSKCFDLSVLRKHYGLKGRVPQTGKHIDMHEIMSAEAGFRVSLNKAVALNFGERKHTDGRKMNALNDEQIRIACRSDVSQTHRLFRRFVDGTLLSPARAWARRDEEPSDCGNMPRECPSCQSVNSLVPVELDMDEMSEGQHSDYVAGMWEIAECRSCGEVIAWGI